MLSTAERLQQVLTTCTDEHVLVVGLAGTGKTYATVNLARSMGLSADSLGITSTTSNSAKQIKGSTVHKLAGLGKNPDAHSIESIVDRVRSQPRVKRRIKALKLLLIDEISMMSAHAFTALEAVLRAFRDPEKDFGGVRLVLVGDFLQLPPVVVRAPGMSAEEYSEKVKSSWLFLSDVWKRNKFTCIKLEEFKRSVDPVLQRIVKHLSEGRLTSEDVQELNKCKQHTIPASDSSVVLSPLNSVVARVNSQRVQERLKKQKRWFFSAAEDNGDAELLRQTSFASPRLLTLGIGARVMFVKSYDNVKVSTGINSKNGESSRVNIANGSLGYVRDYATPEFCKGRLNSAALIGRPPSDQNRRILIVRLEEGYEVFVGLDDESADEHGEGVSRTQFPLCLAYALTIHKSQGKTLSGVHISAKAADFFVSPLLYVAISRVKSLSGLTLDPALDLTSVCIAPNYEVLRFYSEIFGA